MVESIKDYLLKKIFFPKIHSIDQPGVIYNISSRKYGGKTTKKRIIYYFEDIIANLQMETIKKISYDKTQDLYYQIGKKQTVRYLLLGKAKQPPRFMLESIIKYLMKIYEASGASVAKNIRIKNEILILNGEDNIICRKTKINDYFCGCLSGVMSFLLGKNVEAKAQCNNCPNNCQIITDPKLQQKFIVNKKKIVPSNKYSKINFKKIISNTNFPSFSRLMKFNRISIDASGKLNYKNKTIIPSEIGHINIISDHYTKNNLEKTLEGGLIEGAEKISKEIFKNKNIKELFIIISSFGWGIPHYKKENNRITISLMNAPFSKYKPLYQAYVINGHLNYIFNKKLKLLSIKTTYNPFIISINYQI